MVHAARAALVLSFSALVAASAAAAPPLSIGERVAARRAVEEVLHAHRLWPADNATPKPPLDAVLTDAEIRDRVEDSLAASAALAAYWHRPITDSMLDAELDRMAAGSRDPALLHEMLEALHGDRALARETLARPALADRLLRAWYARDPRFHRTARAAAESGAGGLRSETAWSRSARRGFTRLDAGEWDELLAQLTRASAAPGGLVEDADAFRAYTVRERSDDAIRIGVTSWPKTPFETWWGSVRDTMTFDARSSASDAASPPAPDGPAPTCADDTWHAVGAATPSARYGHAAVWTGSEMIVWGGYTGSGVVATGGRYVPATDTWYQLTSAGAPSARTETRAVWTGSQMIVWGGQTDPSTLSPVGDGARYSPVDDRWTSMSAAGAPSARQGHTIVWSGTKAIVWGGTTSGGDTNTGAVYDPAADAWTPTATLGAPAVRTKHVAVWAGTRMIVWGGSQGGSIATGGRYELGTDSWTPVATSGAPSIRTLATAAWTGTHMVVWGGNSGGGLLSDGGRYDPAGDSWQPTSTTFAPASRFQHTAVWTGSRMIVFGGDTFTGETPTGGSYDPTGDAWTVIATASAPEKRRSHTAVWTGTEMIVWGGIWSIDTFPPFLQYLDSGARYNPASDSWVPTAFTGSGPPEARFHHTSIWDGVEMVVWGGQGLSGDVGTGGRYNAATDTWYAVSSASAPSARFAHTAVWTGIDMIVWGGMDSSHDGLQTGARYAPSSDTWSATPTAGAPSARAHHAAVWTGGRMVVWGGSDPLLRGDGGRFDPAANAWSAMSNAGAPSARESHSAVWTGTEMIVWGGDAGALVDTGGRYNASSDAWTATAAAGAPSPRYLHTAVWTGSEMIVWGGNNLSASLGTGARYAPATNTWSAVSTSGAPAPRDSHSAVWTGLEMIVWGGESPSATDTGGRYEPTQDAWTATSTTTGAPSPRFGHGAVWAGSKMIVWGGFTAASGYSGEGATYCACRTVYRDADLDGWGTASDVGSSCDGTLPSGYILRSGDCNDANAGIHPGVLDSTCNNVDEDCSGTPDDSYVGGLSQCGLGVCHAVGVFECQNGQVINNCTPGSPTSPTDTVCNALDDDCDGGVDEDYVPFADSWTAMASSTTSRTNHTAVWTGSEMIVFGGDNGSGTVKLGGERYTLSTDSWSALAAGPTKRWHHTAVWTGSRMVVWGGDDNVATIYNTGSRYDPSTNTWAATTTTGAPTARGGHSAVWTSSRMVIWGGADAASTTNTGSRYDPTGNTWSATSTSGAATARAFHTAVWTGSEMIVWGGQSATGTGNALNTGGRYDPTANTWAAVSTTGAPSARYGHVAVWTGTEMLIWGGTNGTTIFGNGARYNPATNTWTSIANLGAPTLRAYASYVWTGSELIVWGGNFRTNENPDTPLADGGRYDPATNTWKTINPLSAPAARVRAAAVWTGSEMIVWGGDPNGASRLDGARYRLQTLCGTGGCQRSGATVCSAGTVSYRCVPAPSTPEVCDGIDNDCNVAVDDGIPIPSGRPSMIATKLDASGNARYAWTATSDTTGYDVTRGSLNTLLSTLGDFTTATNACLGNNVAATAADDGTIPGPGAGLWYLVRPVNTCSGNGSYDDPPPQQGLRDAEINASPAACP